MASFTPSKGDTKNDVEASRRCGRRPAGTVSGAAETPQVILIDFRGEARTPRNASPFVMRPTRDLALS